MAKSWGFWCSCLLSIVFMFAISMQCEASNEERQEYIVYMGRLPDGQYSPSSVHYRILQDVLEDGHVADSLVRTYKKSFNGFAAKLSEQERQRLASMDGVVSIFPSRKFQLHTTRSWDFIGFPETVKRQPTSESNVIIGVIDSGIWPEIETFSDKGFSPPPKKWKGVCNGGLNFTCNNKIIGARYYNSDAADDNSARDVVGHGTHTASTAAGNAVKNASFFGLAQGTARGGVPSARIAVYKACHENRCSESDILASFDDAISDGVDIISISLGPGNALSLIDDGIAIGSFHAMEKGILTVHSAGNLGPNPSTVVSIAPWLLTVAASTIDRKIIDNVVLGNQKILRGRTINSFKLPMKLPGKKFSLIYGKNATTDCDDISARMCSEGCLNRGRVKGKIVLCDEYRGITEAKKAGALGVIAQKTVSNDASFVVPLPATGLNPEDYQQVLSYMSTKSPQANILSSEAVHNSDTFAVASFSSRGPNPIIPEILKPDISAPGVEILASYSPFNSPSEDPIDKRSVKFNLMSGTSMACPHVSAAAAYVKSFHPDWSPSAIKSALMTTALPMNPTNDMHGGIFSYGAGHVNPIKAVAPGLVYEASREDFIKMLCNMGVTQGVLRLVAGSNSSCSKQTKNVSLKDFNYPIMAAQVQADKNFTVVFTRTVTNVGIANSVYKLRVHQSSQVSITVKPRILYFKWSKEQKSFAVTVTGKIPANSSPEHSLLEWFDGTHTVQSRIVVYNDLQFPGEN